MKKLILILALFFSVTVSSQTYECDSTAFYPDVYERAYRLRAEAVWITIQGTDFLINHNDTLIEEFKISDTILRHIYPDGTQITTFVIDNINDPKDQRIMGLDYFRGRLRSISVLRTNDEMILYHVKYTLRDG